MASQTPPPYFPQGFSGADEKRYRRFKLIIAAIIFFVALILTGIGIGVYYLVKALF